MPITIVVAAHDCTRSCTAVLTSQVARKRKSHLVQSGVFRLIEVPHLDAVVRVDARTSRNTQRIGPHPVVVGDDRKPGLRTPQNLPSEARVTVELRVGLPSVDEPRFNLQLVGRKPLDSDTVKEPRRVRRYKRRLVGPVVEIVVAKEPNIGHKNSGVDVQPMVHVEVVPTPPLGEMPVRVVQVPLSYSRAGIISGRRCRK